MTPLAGRKGMNESQGFLLPSHPSAKIAIVDPIIFDSEIRVVELIAYQIAAVFQIRVEPTKKMGNVKVTASLYAKKEIRGKR